MSGALPVAGGQRGAPLFALILLVGGWIALRILLWHLPFIAPSPAHAERASETARWGRNVMSGRQGSPKLTGTTFASIRQLLQGRSSSIATDLGVRLPSVGQRVPTRHALAPRKPLMAAFAPLELTSAIPPHFAPDRPGNAVEPALVGALLPVTGRGLAQAGETRWTGDAWLLVRKGSGGSIAPGEPSYGRSQAGAVLRYRLARTSGHRPLAYVRATRALSGPRESEAAVGLAARPIVGLPLRVASEVRLSEGAARREVRPAVYAVSELPPADLPLGLRAEAYVQAGYVGGRYATAFVDGQVRLDGPVVRFGRETQLRAGGGLWGGAQKGAGRLDAGPSATMSFLIGNVRSRVAADYRVRLAGGAAPKSGPALTISAGF